MKWLIAFNLLGTQSIFNHISVWMLKMSKSIFASVKASSCWPNRFIISPGLWRRLQSSPEDRLWADFLHHLVDSLGTTPPGSDLGPSGREMRVLTGLFTAPKPDVSLPHPLTSQTVFGRDGSQPFSGEKWISTWPLKDNTEGYSRSWWLPNGSLISTFIWFESPCPETLWVASVAKIHVLRCMSSVTSGKPLPPSAPKTQPLGVLKHAFYSTLPELRL